MKILKRFRALLFILSIFQLHCVAAQTVITTQNEEVKTKKKPEPTSMNRFVFPPEKGKISYIETKKGKEIKVSRAVDTKFYVRIPKEKDTPAPVLRVPLKSGKGFKKLKSIANETDKEHIYKIVGLPLGDDGTASIQVCDDSTCSTSTTIVFGDTVKTINPTNCPSALTLENNFGERPEMYDENKIVFLYNFDDKGTAPEIYKFTKNGPSLQRSLANPAREKLRTRNIVTVKIVNFNRYLYNAAVSDSLVNFDADAPAAFDQLFAGNGSIFDGLLSNFSESLGIKKGVPGDDDDYIKERDSTLVVVLKMMNELRARYAETYFPLCVSKWDCCPNDTIVLSFKKHADALLNARIVLAKEEVMAKSLKEELTKQKDALKKCEESLKKKEANDKEVKRLAEIKPANEAEQKEIKAKIDKLNAETAALPACDPTVPKAEIEKIEKALLDISAFLHLSQQLPSVTQLRNIIVFLSHKTRSNEVEVFGPYYPDANRLDLEIKVQSRDSTANRLTLLPYHRNPIKFELPVIWRGFITFSTGPFAALGSNLNNKTYAWQRIPDGDDPIGSESRYRLVESGYTARPLGFAALGHVQWKVDRYVGIGFNLGAGVTIETTPRAAYFAGLSAFFGKDRQFTLNGGLMAMNVKKLSNNLRAVANQRITFTATEDISYYDEFRTGIFVSLGYTPFRTSSKNPAN